MDGHQASLDLDYDPAFLACVACSGVVDLDRVLGSVEHELIVAGPHPESEFSAGVLEQLKANFMELHYLLQIALFVTFHSLQWLYV